MAEASAPYLYVKVCDWFRIPSVNGDYISYGIRSNASDDPYFTKLTFLTRRPYSDFDDLRQLLVSRHGDVQVPDIPPRVPPEDEFSDNTIQIRMRGFQQFIDKALAIIELKSDPYLKFFIQSHLSMDKIREEIDLISNRQNEERTSQNNPDAEVPMAVDPDPDEHMDDQGTYGYIFDMDDLD